MLLLEITRQGHDGLPADQNREHDTDQVAHIAAIAGQIRHQLDEEREAGKNDEAPDKRPIRGFALMPEQPTGQYQQRQRDCQSNQEHLQFQAQGIGIIVLLRRGLQRGQTYPGFVSGLLGIKQGLVLGFQSPDG
ncbi:MAG: hypothetical protein ACOVKN_08860 [Arenimonas sp.]